MHEHDNGRAAYLEVCLEAEEQDNLNGEAN